MAWACFLEATREAWRYTPKSPEFPHLPFSHVTFSLNYEVCQTCATDFLFPGPFLQLFGALCFESTPICPTLCPVSCPPESLCKLCGSLRSIVSTCLLDSSGKLRCSKPTFLHADTLGLVFAGIGHPIFPKMLPVIWELFRLNDPPLPEG